MWWWIGAESAGSGNAVNSSDVSSGLSDKIAYHTKLAYHASLEALEQLRT